MAIQWRIQLLFALPFSLLMLCLTDSANATRPDDQIAELQEQCRAALAKRQLVKARTLTAQRLKLLQRKYPQGSLDIVGTRHDLALLWKMTGKPYRALLEFKNGIKEIGRLKERDLKLLRQQPDLFFLLLVNLAESQRIIGRIGPAESTLRLALKLATNDFSGRVPKRTEVTIRNNLATVLMNKGDFDAARKLYNTVLKSRERFARLQFAGAKRSLAITVSNLGRLEHFAGHARVADKMYKRALKLFRQVDAAASTPNSRIDIAKNYNNRGFLFKWLGDLPTARQYYERCITLCRQQQRESDSAKRLLALSLHNLGVLLEFQGETRLAEERLGEAVRSFQAIYPRVRFPHGTHRLATAIESLARIKRSRGQFRDTELLLQEVFRMRQSLFPAKRFPRGHRDIASTHNHFGLLYKSQRRWDDSLRHFRQAWQVNRTLYPQETFPRGHVRLAQSLNNLATAEMAVNRLSDARRHFEESLAMNKAILAGGDKVVVPIRIAAGQRNLAEVCLLQRDDKSALKHLLASLTAYDSVAQLIFSQGSEAESLNFVSQFQGVRSALISTALRQRLPAQQLYSACWRSRGAILRLISLRHRQVTQFKNKKAQDLAAKLRRLRRQLSLQSFAPTATLDPALLRARRLRLKRLIDEKESAERKLADVVPDGGALRRAKMPLTDLLAQIPPGTALIDFVLYSKVQVRAGKVPRLTSTPSYVAFVLSKEKGIQAVDLGAAKRIDLAVSGWRGKLRARNAGQKRLPDLFIQQPESATKLHTWIWSPIASLLPATVKRLYIVPAGSLTAVPWNAIPDEKGRCSIHRYSIAVVPSGQHLLAALTTPFVPRLRTLLAVGDVDYDKIIGGPADQPWKPKKRRAKRLPGTKSEIAFLKKLPGKHKFVGLEGAAATTSAVRRELSRSRWAIFATHGFFAKSSVRSLLQPRSDVFSSQALLRRGERSTLAGRNPLLLSGLILAGHNRVPRAEPGGQIKDDSVLRGESIAALPLHGLEVAVLSACETGLGDVAGTEGVFGLQRAFHMAGVRTVVASLWSVPDRATSLLMQQFYQECFGNRLPAIDALRKSQLTFVRRLNQLKMRKPKHRDHIVNPYYWAAFTVSGIGRK